MPKLGYQNHPTMPVRPLRLILLILPLYGFGQTQNLYFVREGQPVRVLDIRGDSIYGTARREGRWDSVVFAPEPKMFPRRIDTVRGDRDGPFFRRLKKHRVRRGVWVTPSGAEDIRGMNIGLMTSNWSANHKLNIRGVNLNADVGSACVSVMFVPYIPIMIISDLLSERGLADREDTVWRHGWPESKEWAPEAGEPGGRISGLSRSGGGLMFPSLDVSGVAINGGICSVPKLNGMVVTGLMTLSNEFHGVMITGVANLAEKGRGLQIGTSNGCGEMRGGQMGLLNGCREMKGVQIGLLNGCREMKGMQMGLYNRCKHGKGIQIGLWNVNGKRKLPLINWGFS